MSTHTTAPITSSWRNPLVRLGVGLLIGGVAVWLVVSTAGGITEAAAAVHRMRAGFVFIAVGLAFARLGLYGRQLMVLGRRSAPLGVGTASGLALVIFGFGAVTPAAPAEGLAVAGHELRRRGHTKRQTLLTLGLSEWFAQRTFYAVAAVDVLIVVGVGRLRLTDSWPFVIAAVMVIAALAATAVFARRPTSALLVAKLLGMFRLRRPGPPPETQREAAGEWHADAMTIVGSRFNRTHLAVVSAGAVLCDSAILWATCQAAGVHMPPELVLLATTVGTMLSWVPLLPSGLGMVEAAIPAVLHRFGAPLDDALAATLVYRAAGTLLPAIVGMLAIVVLKSHRVPRPRYPT